MIQFQCDYNEGCHPEILAALQRTNMEQTVGYGEDAYCAAARDAVRRAIGREDADVHFLVGGTQTNATVIASILRPYQGVLSADRGHINVGSAYKDFEKAARDTGKDPIVVITSVTEQLRRK